MRPNFGTIIWDLLMDPATGQVEKLVKEDIQKILTRDPRVEEKQVKVLVLDNAISAEVVIDVVPFNSVETLYLNYTQQLEEGVS
jgi:phage baseplate assembly protein W